MGGRWLRGWGRRRQRDLISRRRVECAGVPDKGTVYDLWEGNATAPQFEGEYTATRFNDVAARLIATHAQRYGADTPMFMYYAMQ